LRVKLIKAAAIGLAGLVILAVLVLVFGVPAQPLVAYLGDQAAQAGYSLRVDGASRLSLWPSLNISADDVRLSEASGTREELLAAKHVRVGISLLGLLSGDIRINDVGVKEPIIRLTSGRRTGEGGRASPTTMETAKRQVAIDRFTIEDGTLIMRDAREDLEGRIVSLQLTASMPSQGPLDITAEGKAGDQILRFTAKANALSQIVDGRPTPIEARLELPGLLKAPLSLAATLKAANQRVSIDGVRGTLGSGRVNGSVAIDVAGARPHASASLVFDRLELAAPSRPATGTEPWSDRPIEFRVLRVFEAVVKLSARELVVRNIHLAPAEIEANLAGGLLSVLLSSSELYGGPIQGKLVIDAGSRDPRHGVSLDFSKANALPFLTDAIGFDHLEGRLQAKIDVTASGASPAAIVSSLGGTAQLGLEDGAIRDVNVPAMTRALSSQMLQGWQEKGSEKTQLASLAATFRVANGQATTDDLRLAGPLVRMTGKGTANLTTQTLDFRVDPRLVLSLQGQGGPADPAGLGVPVVIRGAWNEPQIYPEIAGILDNPEAAFAKLKAMGGSLFGFADQPTGGGAKKPKVDEVIKSLDQIIRGDGRGRQGDTKGQARDVIRDLLGR
jgi:AsmA protein